jgi:hypothetical protein
MAHIVGAGDFDKRLAFVAPFNRLTLLMRRELRPTAKLYAPRFGPCAAFAGTGADQITFELSEASEHGQQEATVRRGRVEIRARFGFREATVADAEALEAWLRDQVAGTDPALLMDRFEARCRDLLIEPPSGNRVDRIVRAAIRAHDDRFCAGIQDRLTPETRTRLEALLHPDSGADGTDGSGADQSIAPAPAVLLRLRGSPGRPSLAGIQDELAKLEVIRAIALPAGLFDGVRPHDLERYRRRVAVEAPYELRRHPEPARLTWLAAFVHLRGRTLTDDLVDLLIETVHRIGARAERRVEREMLNLLFEIAGASIDKPDGTVREVVFPVVGEQILRDLVKEGKVTGPAYRTTLRTVIRNSYKGHYRRMVPQLLDKLEFRSNNEHHRPVIQALDLLKRHAGSKLTLFPAEETVPTEGIVRGLWRDATIEKDAEGRKRVNRITSEICVLEALRNRLRCKEIWVAGANRYRNSDEDLPTDFEAQRPSYYQALDLPLEADRFITTVQADMRTALARLDAGLPGNRLVRITGKRGGSITVTPFEPQPEPPNLTALKAAITTTWPMTSLLDMVKETDLRLGFSEALKSPTAYEALDRAMLQPRLLLCLHGLGTNAGLQRMAGLQSGVTARDLAYVRRRYLTTDGLRRAIAIVTNGTLHARNPTIWGDGTTAACVNELRPTLLTNVGSPWLQWPRTPEAARPSQPARPLGAVQKAARRPCGAASFLVMRPHLAWPGCV